MHWANAVTRHASASDAMTVKCTTVAVLNVDESVQFSAAHAEHDLEVNCKFLTSCVLVPLGLKLPNALVTPRAVAMEVISGHCMNQSQHQ